MHRGRVRDGDKSRPAGCLTKFYRNVTCYYSHSQPPFLFPHHPPSAFVKLSKWTGLYRAIKITANSVFVGGSQLLIESDRMATRLTSWTARYFPVVKRRLIVRSISFRASESNIEKARTRGCPPRDISNLKWIEKFLVSPQVHKFAGGFSINVGSDVFSSHRSSFGAFIMFMFHVDAKSRLSVVRTFRPRLKASQIAAAKSSNGTAIKCGYLI